LSAKPQAAARRNTSRKRKRDTDHAPFHAKGVGEMWFAPVSWLATNSFSFEFQFPNSKLKLETSTRPSHACAQWPGRRTTVAYSCAAARASHPLPVHANQEGIVIGNLKFAIYGAKRNLGST
jgi:hypothetical protein